MFYLEGLTGAMVGCGGDTEEETFRGLPRFSAKSVLAQVIVVESMYSLLHLSTKPVSTYYVSASVPGTRIR